MSIQRSIRLSLAGAIALALFGIAAVATAQSAPQQTAQQVPPPAPPPPPATSMQPPPGPPAAPAQPAAPPPQSTMPAQPAQAQAAPQQAASGGQFYQGTETSATYPLPDSHGGTLTVNSGMPAHVQSYGPPPSFKSLDTNHDGRISEAEARAYPPLDSDFLYASGGGKSISRAQYKKWVQNLH